MYKRRAHFKVSVPHNLRNILLDKEVLVSKGELVSQWPTAADGGSMFDPTLAKFWQAGCTGGLFVALLSWSSRAWLGSPGLPVPTPGGEDCESGGALDLAR